MAVDARKILANVNPKYYLWVCDGQIIKNLQELSNALARMNNNVFRYHVTRDRNDFRQWVKDVLEDPVLTRKMGKYRAVRTMHKVVKRRLDYLKKKRKRELASKIKRG